MRKPHPFLTGLMLVILLALPAAAGQEPPLPDMGGAQEEAPEEPPLPETGGAESGEPALPTMPDTGDAGEAEPGLPEMPAMPDTEGEESPPETEPQGEGFSDHLDRQLEALPVPLHGFWEMRLGPRIVDDNDHSRDFTLGETRLQLESDPFWRGMDFMFKVDFLYDAVLQEALANVREANVSFSPVDFMDVKVGRQILTWGTGDLVFLNDLFPKDYESFFIGRDLEYLKAPSDAARFSFFTDVANLDLVYTPHFDPDNFVTGKRLSYYNPMLGARAGDSMRVRADEPSGWFEDEEIALRVYRNVGSYELAGYGYHGFWKSPAGTDPASGRSIFPPLDVWGGSVRGPVAGGIGNAEFAYYDSRDDQDGDDPLVRNGELRFLVGYSRDLPRVAEDFTVGVQYYLEHMLDHGNYERTLPAGMPEADENRHLFTLRLTKLLMNQDMRVELFTFWSPSDHDAYLRPYVRYDITDRWRIDGGANIFLGDEGHTQFGQLDRNNNIYVGLRYSF